MRTEKRFRYSPQYIYFSISSIQRRLKTTAVPNDFGGTKMIFHRWTWENCKTLQKGNKPGRILIQNLMEVWASMFFPVPSSPESVWHGWRLLSQTLTAPSPSCLKWPLPSSLVITLTVIAMTDHFINCKLHYLKMVTTDMEKGTEYPNFS